MGAKINVSIVVIAIYSLYYGYMSTARWSAIKRRRLRAKQAKDSGDLEILRNSSPEEQFAVLVVGGRFVNPFPEYREHGIFEFIVWKIVEVIRWNPRAGVPRDKTLLAELLPLYRPDFEVLFDTSTVVAATGSDLKTESNPDLSPSGNASPMGLTSSVTSAVYYSSDTGSSTNIQFDSMTLADSWTPISQRYVANATSHAGSHEAHSLSDTSSNTTSSGPHSPAADETATRSMISNGIPPRDERLTVTWIGQSCIFIQCHGINFLTDPLFSAHIINSLIGPKRLRPSPCQLEHLPRIDFVLVSHDHPDHLEDETIRKIGNSAMWIVPVGLRRYLARYGIYRVAEMKWWDKIPLPGKERDGWEIACTPAMHWSGRYLYDSNRSLWCSFLILHNTRPVIFHAGDTGYSAELFKGISQVYGTGCELALVPCGAYSPRWHLQPQHVDPAESVQIMIDLGAKRLVGVHWATFMLSDEHYLEPKQKLEQEAVAAGLQDKVWAAEFGRTIVVPYRSADEAGSGSDDDAVFRLPDARVSSIGRLRALEGRHTLIW
ncbi:beta-lactamase superfamily domain-containing protein [Lipomyces tetrasporus]|uniref:Beta-lactamase superfamily domain-containing protein n=1 Tax=Lipomyces tetrasporus TaxID=54092 RepID=A0AAD7VTI7_9ASCO|nr:beta-lactamase superfamily domain-containing protein [Lipomyces tetrasporus]KAJ8102142.1 beta-lactamase superfamily domain-containing protein [Lipomyces tetrasporus]